MKGVFFIIIATGTYLFSPLRLCIDNQRIPIMILCPNESDKLLIVVRIEFFLNNTNLTLLAFLYKIDIKGFQNQQEIKWESNSQYQPSMDYKADAYSTLPPRPVLNRRSKLNLDHLYIQESMTLKGLKIWDQQGMGDWHDF